MEDTEGSPTAALSDTTGTGSIPTADTAEVTLTTTTTSTTTTTTTTISTTVSALAEDSNTKRSPLATTTATATNNGGDHSQEVVAMCDESSLDVVSAGQTAGSAAVGEDSRTVDRPTTSQPEQTPSLSIRELDTAHPTAETVPVVVEKEEQVSGPGSILVISNAGLF